jgi:uncharacterized ion transporter superfamily protein YfcC
MASTVNPSSIGVASEFAGVGLGDGIALRWIGWLVLTAIAIAYVVRYAERVKARPERSLVGFPEADGREVAKEQAAAELTLTGRQTLVLAITAFSRVARLLGHPVGVDRERRAGHGPVHARVD